MLPPPLAPGPTVGHCSGATGLEVLAPHEAFSLHPLMTITAEGAGSARDGGVSSGAGGVSGGAGGVSGGAGGVFAGAGAAIAGSSPHALRVAAALAAALELNAVEIAATDRPAYHAAASIASNFLITLEAAAERLAAGAGMDRSLLVPLVRQTVENWAALGPQRALTGPVARGDEATVAVQRQAVGDRAPDLLPLFDALLEATRTLAHAPAVGVR